SALTIPGAMGSPVSPARAALLRALLRLRPRLRPLRGPGSCGRRAVILHIDGVSRSALAEAMRAGEMPFLSRLLAGDSHRLAPTVCGAPASTSAFQAGLLYGRVDDVPGYLWYDKRRRATVRMNRGEHVEAVEAR